MTFLNERDVAARQELLSLLRNAWPDSVSYINPSRLPSQPSAESFIKAALGLQDAGLAMFEVIDRGCVSCPVLRVAAMTYRGMKEGI